MKKTFDIWFLLLLMGIGLTSCGDTYYTDDFLNNSSEKLCNCVWEEVYDTYTENMEVECVHRIQFNTKDGHESVTYFREGQSIPISKQEYAFFWEWGEDMETIKLKYGTGNNDLFENVWVRQTYLSGKLHGKVVTFKKINR